MGLKAQENKNNPEIQPNTAQEQTADQPTVDPTPIKPAIPTPTDEASAKHDRGGTKDGDENPKQYPDVILGDGWAQWAMVGTSVLALAVSAWAVWLLKKTLHATREAVRAADDAVTVTQKIGTEQLRAYLSVESAHIIFDEAVNVVRITLKNFGQTPAYNVRACFFRTDERPEVNVIFPDEGFSYLGSIPPNGEICKDMPSDEFRAPNIISDVIMLLPGKRTMGESDPFFWVVGKVLYQDAFGRDRVEFSEYRAVLHNGTPTMAICRNESS